MFCIQVTAIESPLSLMMHSLSFLKFFPVGRRSLLSSSEFCVQYGYTERSNSSQYEPYSTIFVECDSKLLYRKFCYSQFFFRTTTNFQKTGSDVFLGQIIWLWSLFHFFYCFIFCKMCQDNICCELARHK